MKSTGFSLIEVLVSIAIASLVMAAILALQNGAIDTTTNVTNASDRLKEQTTAISYIADRFRGARKLYDTAATPITLDSTTSPATTCSNASSVTTPCIAFLSSETTWDPTDATYAAGGIKRYVLLAYRYQPRTDFTDRQPNSWADSNSVKIIMEYRRELKTLDTTCPTKITCTASDLDTAAATTPSATNGQWTKAMLTDGLTLAGAAGTFTPWTLDTANGVLTIKIRSLYQQGSAAKYYPLSGLTSMQVVKRN